MDKNLLLSLPILAAIALPSIAADATTTARPGAPVMKQHHEMMLNMMNMMKDTMSIIASMDHRPSDADKQRLAEMQKKLDDMIKQEQGMTGQMKDMRQDRMMRRDHMPAPK